MNLKKTLQEPMRRRQTRKYEERISSQTVAYHDWILKKEKAVPVGTAFGCFSKMHIMIAPEKKNVKIKRGKFDTCFKKNDIVRKKMQYFLKTS